MLEYVRNECILLEDGSSRWIDIERFIAAGEGAFENGGLAALLANPRYRYDYMTPRSNASDWGVHGPYRLEAISPDSFEVIDEETATATIRRVVNADDSVAVQRQLESGILPVIETATERFRLRDLGEDAQHDLGHILWDFTELVLYRQPTSEVALVVTAID